MPGELPHHGDMNLTGALLMAKNSEVNKSQAVRDYSRRTRRPRTRKWSTPWRKRASPSRPATSAISRPRTTNEAGLAEVGCQGRRRHPRGQGGPGFPQAHRERRRREAGPCGGAGDQGDPVGDSCNSFTYQTRRQDSCPGIPASRGGQCREAAAATQETINGGNGRGKGAISTRPRRIG